MIRPSVAAVLRRFSSDQHIFFLHIAKCGGKSVNSALRRKFPGNWATVNPSASVEAARRESGFEDPYDDRYEAVLRFREHLLIYYMASDVGLILGHFAFSETAFQAFGDRYKYVTLLRNPVDRYLSHYDFNSRKEEGSPWKIDETLDEFIESERGREAGADYVKYLGGVRADGDYHSQEAIQTARANLDRFTVVGLLEDIPNLEDQLLSSCGLRVRVGHRNKTPGAGRRRIEPELRTRIEAICAGDIVLYEAARKKATQSLL